MRVLVKFPTRERPRQFMNVLNLMNELAINRKYITYLITCDIDDTQMSHEVRDNATNIENVHIIRGVSRSKIHACNRDMTEISAWDIVILVSDDMIPQIHGWDQILRESMKKYYPDTDGALWFNDGYQDSTCTLTVFGRKYYERFGYLYHPDYHSLFCDNEQTEVGVNSGKMTYIEQVLFRHEHFINNSSTKRDSLYQRNEALFNIDKITYERRKSQGFPI